MKIIQRWSIVAVVGSYEKAGQIKKKYKRVGTLCDTETGPVIFLDRSFNPAGIDCPPGEASVLLSCYSDDEGNRRQPAEPDDDIPF